jgi:Arc/MetJ-type ribon-helix-helix transcriptional regulator
MGPRLISTTLLSITEDNNVSSNLYATTVKISAEQLEWLDSKSIHGFRSRSEGVRFALSVLSQAVDLMDTLSRDSIHGDVWHDEESVSATVYNALLDAEIMKCHSWSLEFPEGLERFKGEIKAYKKFVLKHREKRPTDDEFDAFLGIPIDEEEIERIRSVLDFDDDGKKA